MTDKKQKGSIWIEAGLCKGTEGCGLCLEVCPEEVLGISETLSSRGVHPAVVADLERCTGCGLCVLHCPELAMWLERVR